MSFTPAISDEGSSLQYLSHAIIADALSRSPDHGATIDLSKRNLSDVGDPGAEELASTGVVIQRIALSANHLSTLPSSFSSLSRLRYLNLKNNAFTIFPQVLTLLPTLDTLDISHNKIRTFPVDCGTLANLRVLCLSRNKLRQLPKYLAKFRHLSILKADRNPLEWPPKHVMEPGRLTRTSQEMREFVHAVQRYMDENPPKDVFHDDVLNGTHTYDSWPRFPINDSDFDAGVTPHARTFSVDSSYSISSLADSVPEVETSSSDFLSPERPSRLRMGLLDSYTMNSLRSPDSYLPSPADSATSSAEDLSLHQLLHNRNASFAGGRHSPLSKKTEMFNKQSMPDLRTAKLNFAKKSTPPPKPKEDLPSPLSLRQDSGSSASASSHSRIVPPFTRSTPPPPPLPSSSSSPSVARPSMDFERNSYFRRISQLPISIITTTLPEPLVCLIDAARTILFALSQVYQAFEHYLIYAIDDRLSSVLRKVLDPASVDIMHLIDSLDRFDVLSKKKLPPPAACRSVVESCRDTVAVFGKALGVLALQLKVLANGKDVRYLRHMLLVLYGATAEVGFAWKKMMVHSEAIKPLLNIKSYHHPVGSSSRAPVLEQRQTPSKLRSNTTDVIEGGRIRTARRHAGSFSSKDVELGRSLPSYDDFPIRTGGVITGNATQMATPRARRKLTGPWGTSTPRTKTPPLPPVPFDLSRSLEEIPVDHSRQASQASNLPDSPSIPNKTTAFLDAPNSSKNQVDKEALQAVKAAIEVAPAVWEGVEEFLGPALGTNTEAKVNLSRAQSVTQRLTETIRGFQEGESTLDSKLLREDAHVFTKTVVQLSNVMKSHAGSLPSGLRSNMVKLTNATEEFAILLHVSSFSPAANGSLAPPTQGAGLVRSRSAQASTPSPVVTPLEGPKSARAYHQFKIPSLR